MVTKHVNRHLHRQGACRHPLLQELKVKLYPARATNVCGSKGKAGPTPSSAPDQNQDKHELSPSVNPTQVPKPTCSPTKPTCSPTQSHTYDDPDPLPAIRPSSFDDCADSLSVADSSATALTVPRSFLTIF